MITSIALGAGLFAGGIVTALFVVIAIGSRRSRWCDRRHGDGQ